MIATRGLCNIEIDLQQLPPNAFERIPTSHDTHYQVNYELEIIFNAVIELNLFCERQEMGNIMAYYV